LLTEMFARAGAEAREAEARAGILYWAYLGYMTSSDGPATVGWISEIWARFLADCVSDSGWSLD